MLISFAKKNFFFFFLKQKHMKKLQTLAVGNGKKKIKEVHLGRKFFRDKVLKGANHVL